MFNSQLPIGVFDSGIGGLTVVNALKKAMPLERIYYFGDTAHLPYGDKSPEVLRQYVARIMQFLLERGVKAIVVACNTAAATAYPVVQALAGSIPTFEVISPAVATAISATRSGRIGVIATKTTVQSHVYLRQLLERQPDVHVLEKATPLLVPMIEEGWFDNQISHEIIEAYMSDTGFAHIDTLILGCTHYPLIATQIAEYFAQNTRQSLRLVDSSEVTATTVAASLNSYGLLNTKPDSAEDHFFVSDLTPGFQSTANLFFGKTIRLEKV